MNMGRESRTVSGIDSVNENNPFEGMGPVCRVRFIDGANAVDRARTSAGRKSANGARRARPRAAAEGEADLHAFVCLKGHHIERLPLPIPPVNVSEPFHCAACEKIYLRFHDGQVKAAPMNRCMF